MLSEKIKHYYNMIIRGMHYSLLCDIFPLLHSKKAFIKIRGKNIAFEIKKCLKRIINLFQIIQFAKH